MCMKGGESLCCGRIHVLQGARIIRPVLHMGLGLFFFLSSNSICSSCLNIKGITVVGEVKHNLSIFIVQKEIFLAYCVITGLQASSWTGSRSRIHTQICATLLLYFFCTCLHVSPVLNRCKTHIQKVLDNIFWCSQLLVAGRSPNPALPCPAPIPSPYASAVSLF